MLDKVIKYKYNNTVNKNKYIGGTNMDLSKIKFNLTNIPIAFCPSCGKN